MIKEKDTLRKSYPTDKNESRTQSISNVKKLPWPIEAKAPSGLSAEAQWIGQVGYK